MKLNITNEPELKTALAFIDCNEVRQAKETMKRLADCKAFAIAKIWELRKVNISELPAKTEVEITCDGIDCKAVRIGKQAVDIQLLRAAYPQQAKQFTSERIETHWK